MSISAMQNAMRLQAMLATQDNMTTRIGTVTGYDQNTYSAKVTMQPEGYITGWLPICSPWVGNNWGLFCPPTDGDQVLVHFQEGALEAGVIGMRLYSDAARPLSVPSGELLMEHQSGSLLQFLNNGDIQVTSNRDLLATVGRNLTATVAGNASAEVTGNLDIDVSGNAEIDVVGDITSSAVLWTHTGALTVNGPITGTQGINITGTYLSGPTAYITGTIHFNGATITADGSSTMTFNGKRVDDTLRVTGVQTGSGTSGMVA